MTPEAQRIAIAETVPGWRSSHGGKYCAFIHEPTNAAMNGLFDPLIDLNAMHEAVAYKLSTDRGVTRWTAGIFSQYVQHLVSVVTRENLDWMRRGTEECCIEATAAQRAEAFLRTIGKWMEE